VSRADQSCGGHAGLPGELRAVVLLALERITPLLERVTTEPATGPSSCANCPVCALLAALRGERPELAVRLADHASGLVTALRSALEDTEPSPRPEPPTRTVQHIRVERVRAAR
jgi:hypothetical protein